MAVSIRRRSVAQAAWRDQVLMVGSLDGINRIFEIPGGEKAEHNPTGGIKMKPYHNTRRLQDTEFDAVESAGAGTGYDRIVLKAFAPPPSSRIFLDFVAK